MHKVSNGFKAFFVATYPYVGKMYAVTICAVDSCGLSDICGNSDNERDWNVLEDKNPRSPVHCKAASAAAVIKSVKESISSVRNRAEVCNEEEEVARQSDRLVEVCPWLKIDRARKVYTGSQIDKSEERDQRDDSDDFDLFAWVAEVCRMYYKLEAGDHKDDCGEGTTEDLGKFLESERAGDIVDTILGTCRDGRTRGFATGAAEDAHFRGRLG